MSFDIFFQPCRFGDKPVEKRNPFTGKMLSVLPNEKLTDEELQAVQKVLREAKAIGPDESGSYTVEFADGGHAEITGAHLNVSSMVAVSSLTPGLVEFLFDMLVAGRWVMLPTTEIPMAITNSRANLCGIPEGFPPVVECKTKEELHQLLEGGVESWQRYRDHVIDEMR